MRHNWVKRVMALLLASMVISLTACGGSSSSSSSDSDSEDEETEAEEEEEVEEEEEDDYIIEEGTSVEIEPVTMVDTDDCSMVVTGLSLGDTTKYDSVLTATLTVEIENKTGNTDLTFSQGYVSINDLIIYSYILEDTTVEAGETAEIHYAISGGSDDLTDIYVFLSTEDGSVSGSAHIYPSGEENAVTYEREAQDTDIVLCEEDGVTILYYGGEDNYSGEDWNGYSLRFYAENSSDSDVYFELMPVAVNGTEVNASKSLEGIVSKDLYAGKKRFTGYLMYKDYLLEDLELTDGSEIETVDVQLVIYDLETEKELYTTTVTITVN